jgi:hypothetical protein
VAKKRRRKRSWLKTLLLFIATPLLVWFLAFLTWFYWNDLVKLAVQDRPEAIPKAVRKAEWPAENKSNEKILEEDRRKLEDILNKSR